MSGIHHCLTPALAFQKSGLPWSDAPAHLEQIRIDCAHPDVCAHRDIGCRKVSADYLRPFIERERVSAQYAGSIAAERARRAG